MKKLIYVIIIMYILSNSILFADNDIATLDGLQKFVVIIYLNDDTSLLTSEQIKTDVELKLRLTGIEILDSDKWTDNLWKTTKLRKVGAFLVVNVDTMLMSNKSTIVYKVDTSVLQWALIRASTYSCYAVTWTNSAFGYVGSSKYQIIRDSIKDEVDDFLNDYLSVNPK